MSTLKSRVLPLVIVVSALVHSLAFDAAAGQKPWPCTSTAVAQSGDVFACPQGDGATLGSAGLTITVVVRQVDGTPNPHTPSSDIWLMGCNDLLVLCGGSGAINADAWTDANGQTTISGAIAAGGCDVGGVRVVVQGIVIGAGNCGQPCVPIKVKSVDIDGNLLANLADFAAFGAGYSSPPKAYNECLDYWAPYGTVSLSDFAAWGQHYNHAC